MGKRHIPLATPHMSEEGYERQFASAAVGGFRDTELQNIHMFESEMADKIGTRPGIALSSGTAAIHMGLMAFGVQEGDIVFAQDLTFSASVNPIVYLRAKPVFIDSDYETWNISPVALERAMEKYEKMNMLPKAVIIVHLYGLTADMDKIIPVCEKYHVPIVEDAAEGLGTTYKGIITNGKEQYVGTFGEYGILSFNGNKIVTTSGGGMLLCNVKDDEKAAERIQKVRCWSSSESESGRVEQREIVYHYHMSGVAAGIGRGQLRVLDKRVAQKQYIYRWYQRELQEIEDILVMPVKENVNSNCWLTAILVDDSSKVSAMDIIKALDEDDIESRPVWKPMHLQPVFAGCDFVSADGEGRILSKKDFEIVDTQLGADNSIAGNLFRRGVCLPSDTKMNDDDLHRICTVIKALFG